MAIIGLSLIVASVVLFCLRPPQWFPRFLANWRQQRLDGPATRPPIAPSGEIGARAKNEEDKKLDARQRENGVAEQEQQQPPPIIIQEPLIQVTGSSSSQGDGSTELHEEEQTTPKASATHEVPSDHAVPTLTLVPEISAPREDPTPILIVPDISTSPAINLVGATTPQQPPRVSAPGSTAMTMPVPQLNTISDRPGPAAPSVLMPPPPLPKKPRVSGIPQPVTTASTSTSSPRRIPTLDPTPNRERNLPIPRRGMAPPSSSSSLGGGLAPPPTHSTIPKKPSRQVTLEPGHSPMDWARLAQSPTSDLRGLPPNSPYLRVTPSMLKQMNGRKGRDAWTVYGGKVYNVSPYVPFHPGGGPELLRGAGKDGTKLFGEVHPWVNYETMLSACLIGLLVDEHETENKMEEMD